MKRLFSALCVILCLAMLTGCRPTMSPTTLSEDRREALDFHFQTAYFDSAKDILCRTDFPKDTAAYPDTPLTVSASKADAFQAYVEDMTTDYTYASYYAIDEALAHYAQRPSPVTGHERMLSPVTAESLMAQVKENNAAFLQKKQTEYTDAFYEELSEEELRSVCQIVAAAVNCYKDAGLLEDPDEVACILADLKVFGRTSMDNAYVDDDNSLIVSPNMIESLKIKSIATEQDVFVSTLAHETMHMLQKGCTHNNALFYSIGHAYKFDDLAVNPLFCRWFYEGAAEKMVLNITGYKPLVYEFYINYLNSMTMSVLLDEAVGIRDVEQSTLSNSLDPLYETFGCATKEQQTELHRLLFSLDIIETDNEGFKTAYDPDMTEEELVVIKRHLKNSLCETMAKWFYTRLAAACTDGDVTLRDAFYLMRIFEHDVNSHIGLTDSEKCRTAQSFVLRYTALQDRFFALLAEENDLSADQLCAMFLSYGYADGEGARNASLSFLSADKQAFFDYMRNATYSDAFTAIRSFQQ